MSVDQLNVIDFVDGDKDAKEITLFITDHLSWDETVPDYVIQLQEKINKYLAYIESGEILERFPYANDKEKVIKVIGKYKLSELAENFYRQASDIVKNAGFELRFEQKD